MNILLVGTGAREHIIAEKLTTSPKCGKLFVYGGSMNPGIAELVTASGGVYRTGKMDDMMAMQAFAKEVQPDFAFIGPDNPIADGAVDTLAEIGISSASPTKMLAQLESSKGFTRELLKKYGIEGNPQFRLFRTDNGWPKDGQRIDGELMTEMLTFARELGQIVVKADGLHGGKGVLVQGDHFATIEEGVEAAKKFVESDGQVVIEEKFVGQEFSLMSFADGNSVVDMPVIQDHKRAFEGDMGPNTGGMGTYNYPENLPFLTAQDLADAHAITVKVAEALKKECGTPFKGIMYGGFMAVKNGVRLIEYNARFGDPEAMNALTLLETDFVDVCLAIINGTLADLDVRWAKKATVCKYVVPEGYPDKPLKGVTIEVGALYATADVPPAGVRRYFASVTAEASGNVGAGGAPATLILGGSRAVAFVGVGDTIEEAEALAQQGVESVKGPVFYRKDIGTKALIEKRITMMRELRG